MLHRMMLHGLWLCMHLVMHASLGQSACMYVCEAGSFFFFFGELHGCFSLEITELLKIAWAELVAQLSDPACMYVCMYVCAMVGRSIVVHWDGLCLVWTASDGIRRVLSAALLLRRHVTAHCTLPYPTLT